MAVSAGSGASRREDTGKDQIRRDGAVEVLPRAPPQASTRTLLQSCRFGTKGYEAPRTRKSAPVFGFSLTGRGNLLLFPSPAEASSLSLLAEKSSTSCSNGEVVPAVFTQKVSFVFSLSAAGDESWPAAPCPQSRKSWRRDAVEASRPLCLLLRPRTCSCVCC